MNEFEIIKKALKDIGFKTVSHETLTLVYHSCALEGCSLTLEETAQNIGFEIIRKLKDSKNGHSK
jgi:hypothetical protein